MTFGVVAQGTLTTAAGSLHTLTAIWTSTVLQLIANVASLADGQAGEFIMKTYVVSGEGQDQSWLHSFGYKQASPVVQTVPFPTSVGTTVFQYNCVSGAIYIGWKVYGLA